MKCITKKDEHTDVATNKGFDLTNLSLEPLQCELFLHLVLDPSIGTVLPLQQGGPAVPRLSVSLHQNDLN